MVRRIGLLITPAALVTPGALAVDYLSHAEAQKVLFPSADAFDQKRVALTGEQLSQIKELSGVRQRTKEPLIWQVLAKGKPHGWFFVDEVVGKHEFITYGVAIDPDAKVLGVEILSYRETHGGEVREASWRAKFVGKTLADKFKLDQDVPNITGATLSCRNVLDGVKRLLVLHKVLSDAKAL